MCYNDYLDTDVTGTWIQIKNSALVKKLYYPLLDLDWDDTYFILNAQKITNNLLDLSNHSNIVISFHTEYYNAEDLFKCFEQHKGRRFLILSDGESTDNIWPDNVNYIQWISYGDQIETAKQSYGYNTKTGIPEHKLSSLSYRHEFHKAAVTAYLLAEFDHNEYILSWHNKCYGEPYYFNDDAIPPSICKYVFDEKFKNIKSITLDQFNDTVNTPILNGQWDWTAYTNAVINLTNESIYNNNFWHGRYTAPYLTEKTWKPLLARQAFLPIGHAGTLSFLRDLGLTFDYGLDLSYDNCYADFDRMTMIYQLLNTIKQIKIEDLSQMTKNATDHNLEMLVSEDFIATCRKRNFQKIEMINKWVE